MLSSKHLSRILRRAVAGLLVLALLTAAPLALTAAEDPESSSPALPALPDAPVGEKSTVVVAAPKGIRVFADSSLSGASTNYPAGTELTVSSCKNGTSCVYDSTGTIRGYCSSTGLVDGSDTLYFLPPYLCENGLVSDLVDLDYYLLTHPDSLLINGRDDTVLLQRDVLDLLERLAKEPELADNQIWIESGYTTSDSDPYHIEFNSGMLKCSTSTGCVFEISLHDANGKKLEVQMQGTLVKKMSRYNFSLYNNPNRNGVFYYGLFGDYLPVDIPMSEMPRLAVHS